MSSRVIASTAVIAAVVVAALVVNAVPGREPLAQRLGTTPVVVELFTSQGCSSCPPADAIIQSIAHDESLRGRVIPLAFHVDYWDRLGWRDPFSATAWTRRQMVYARAFSLNSAYTPQAVVGGRKEFVGSNGGKLDAAIVEVSHAPRAGVLRVDVKRDGANVAATIHAEAGKDVDVMLALVENGISTNVGGGENQGRVIVNEAIVRDLVRVATGAVDKTLTMKPDPAWKNLAVVVFLQDRNSLAITNATTARL